MTCQTPCSRARSRLESSTSSRLGPGSFTRRPTPGVRTLVRGGGEGPGRYFAYNNWDFNTLAAILRQETGADVFEAFDEHFGQPLQMEDWRVSDGYYHYERDKSMYPAYPFRMSARDAARFGLLFARDGVWDGQRVLSEHWIQRSTALYSIDNEFMGYGFMWWVFLRRSQFELVTACVCGARRGQPDDRRALPELRHRHRQPGEHLSTAKRTPMDSTQGDLIAQVLAMRGTGAACRRSGAGDPRCQCRTAGDHPRDFGRDLSRARRSTSESFPIRPNHWELPERDGTVTDRTAGGWASRRVTHHSLGDVQALYLQDDGSRSTKRTAHRTVPARSTTATGKP